MFPKRRWIGPETEIVLEGWGSAGNTFARKALEQSNPGIRIASHIHRWAHAAEGVRRGLPVVVLLRAPTDAIASHVVRMGHLAALDDAIASYLRFHRGIESLAGRVVLVPFDVVRSRFGEVIDRVNERYGTSLLPFDHGPGSTEVLREIQREATVNPTRQWNVAAPNPERDREVAAMQALLETSPYQPRMDACEEVYGRLLPLAEREFPGPRVRSK